MNGNMSEISLKALSNKSLLDVYYEYRTRKDKYNAFIGKLFNGSSEMAYWIGKLEEVSEYLQQIELEILSRMYGMEID